MDLVNKFWAFCHTLRHEGVDYSDYIEELTYLLFLKIAEERGVVIPPGCTWNDLVIHDKEELLKKYNDVLSELSTEKSILGSIFSQPIAKFRSSASLKRLLNLIDEIEWSAFNADVLGAMFEGLLEKAATEGKKGAGQYFTPRPLIEAIVQVMQPNPLEGDDFKISDVACGTAGFVISSYEWLRKKIDIVKLNKRQRDRLFSNTYFGQELVIRPRRMAQMNLFLHGITPNIKLGDTIYEPLDKQRFKCILTNPPFGNKGVNQIPDRNDFKVKTSNKQLNFIQHVASSLANGGRAAIVLPDNVLSEEKATELWKELMVDFNVHTILKLPNGTFLPYTNVKAVVIFLQKGKPTNGIWIYDNRTNVPSITKKGRPLSSEHFLDFIDKYGEDPNGSSVNDISLEDDRFRFFSFEHIKQREYNLDITWIVDNHNNETDSLDVEDLTGEIVQELELIIDFLKELPVILETNNDE